MHVWNRNKCDRISWIKNDMTTENGYRLDKWFLCIKKKL